MDSHIKDRSGGQREHESVLELLPWYVNETLAGRDVAMVLKHLAHCEACQKERDQLYGLQDLIQDEERVDADVSLSLRRVLGRIDSSEKNRESTRDFEPQQSSRYGSWMAAAVAVAVFVTFGWVNLSAPISAVAPTGDEFQTLSSNDLTLGTARRMELGFAQPIPASALRQALIETGSNIVSGPDAGGRYLVEVTVPSDVSMNEFLGDIQTIEGVEFARFTDL